MIHNVKQIIYNALNQEDYSNKVYYNYSPADVKGKHCIYNIVSVSDYDRMNNHLGVRVTFTIRVVYPQLNYPKNSSIQVDSDILKLKDRLKLQYLTSTYQNKTLQTKSILQDYYHPADFDQKFKEWVAVIQFTGYFTQQ